MAWLTIGRWAGKLKRDGRAPALSLTVCPVLSKSSCVKWSLQSRDEGVAVKLFLLRAASHCCLTLSSLGNLPSNKSSWLTQTRVNVRPFNSERCKISNFSPMKGNSLRSCFSRATLWAVQSCAGMRHRCSSRQSAGEERYQESVRNSRTRHL